MRSQCWTSHFVEWKLMLLLSKNQVNTKIISNTRGQIFFVLEIIILTMGLQFRQPCPPVWRHQFYFERWRRRWCRSFRQERRNLGNESGSRGAHRALLISSRTQGEKKCVGSIPGLLKKERLINCNSSRHVLYTNHTSLLRCLKNCFLMSEALTSYSEIFCWHNLY